MNMVFEVRGWYYIRGVCEEWNGKGYIVCDMGGGGIIKWSLGWWGLWVEVRMVFFKVLVKCKKM